MAPIGWLLLVIGVLWLGYGSYWLLTRRRYSLDTWHLFLSDLVGFPVEWTQSTWGRAGVPYAFLMPNMIIFGTFTFLPLLLNFYVSFTGGNSINLFDRPLVGAENYRQIVDCDSILDPRTCPPAGYNFWTGMFNTLLFVVIQVPVLCTVSLLTALVVNKVIVGRGFWRAMFFYPVMLSPVVIANIWKWVLHRKGVLNATLDEADQSLATLSALGSFDLFSTIVAAILLLLGVERALRAERRISLPWSLLACTLFVFIVVWANPVGWLFETSLPANALLAGLASAFVLWQVADLRRWAKAGLVSLCCVGMLLLLTIQFDTVFDVGNFRPVNWLVTPRTGWPFFWLVFVYCWHHMGFYMLILLAGLQAIPRDLYEAATMDAATPFRTFWRITFPLLMPTFVVVLVLSLIKSFQVFDEVYTLTGGGPGRETFMIVQYIFESAFAGSSRSYGQAAAGSVIMAAVIALLTLVQLYITRSQSGIK